MSAPAAPKFFVEQGSIYAPGWHVRERVRDNYLVSRGCFDEKPDAEEFLAHVLEQEDASIIPAGTTLAETLEAGLPVANAQLAQAAEIARLREELDGRKAELDNVMYQFRHLGETTAGLTGLMNDYHTERDSAREDAEILRGQLDDMRDRAEDAESLLEVVREERDWLTARVQELTAAESDAEARDAAVNDAAEAGEES